MARRRGVRLMAPLLAALTLVAGCGGGSSGGGHANESSAPPKSELVDAAKALYDGSVLTTTLSLDTTPAAIQHIAHSGTPTALTTAQAAAIAGTRIQVETTAPEGKTLRQAHGGTTTGSATAVTARSGSTTYLAVHVIGNVLYLQVDLKDLLGLAGESGVYRTAVVRSRTLPDFVRAFVLGKWISMPLSTVSTLEGFASGAVGGKLPPVAKLGSIAGDMVQQVLGDLTVTRTATGTTDHLVAMAQFRQVARDVLDVLERGIPAAAPDLRGANVNEVPDNTVTLTADVTGGQLRRLSLDLGDLAKPQGLFSLPLVAAFAPSGLPITKPPAPVQVDLAQLGALIGALGAS